MAYVLLFRGLGLLLRPVSGAQVLRGCALAALAGSAVESLPLDNDNLAVPLAAVLTSVAAFGF